LEIWLTGADMLAFQRIIRYTEKIMITILKLKKSDIWGREVSGIFPLLGACIDEDERIRIEAYFQCHGGILYSGGGTNSNYPIKSDLWWFGFGCGHDGDKADLDYAIQKFPSHKEIYQMQKMIESKFLVGVDVVRSEEYVADECKKLAEQLKEFERNEENAD
jgi:hypothetical protein